MSKGKKKMEIYGSDIRGGSSMKGGPWTGGSFLRRWGAQSIGREWVGFKFRTTPGTENTRKRPLFIYFIFSTKLIKDVAVGDDDFRWTTLTLPYPSDGSNDDDWMKDRPSGLYKSDKDVAVGDDDYSGRHWLSHTHRMDLMMRTEWKTVLQDSTNLLVRMIIGGLYWLSHTHRMDVQVGAGAVRRCVLSDVQRSRAT
jgi:hypothetical protein